jgi:membrane-bound metal-dependent hydrolase YbcI (DUF457 family)
MLGRRHLLVAGGAFVALASHPINTPWGTAGAPLLNLGEPLTGAVILAASGAVAVASALAPDIDHSGSTIARLGGPVTGVAARVIQFALGHRGPLHSLLAVAGVYLLGTWLGQALGLGGLGSVLAFGWGTHLLADAVTSRGIPALWPLRWQVRLPPSVTTGGWSEGLVAWLWLGACTVWALQPHLGGLRLQ